MTHIELLDSFVGTQHYHSCLDSMVRFAFNEANQKGGSRLKPADNLGNEKFHGSGNAKGKYPTKPQETLGELGFKKDFVYKDGDTALYIRINNLGKGKGTITILGYDKEAEVAKEAEKKDGKEWYKKYLNKTTITGIKSARTDLKNPYVRAKDNHWDEVEAFSTFVNNIPPSFAPLGDFAKDEIFTKKEIVGAGATTANFTSGTDLSMCA